MLIEKAAGSVFCMSKTMKSVEKMLRIQDIFLQRAYWRFCKKDRRVSTESREAIRVQEMWNDSETSSFNCALIKKISPGELKADTGGKAVSARACESLELPPDCVC